MMALVEPMRGTIFICAEFSARVHAAVVSCVQLVCAHTYVSFMDYHCSKLGKNSSKAIYRCGFMFFGRQQGRCKAYCNDFAPVKIIFSEVHAKRVV